MSSTLARALGWAARVGGRFGLRRFRGRRIGRAAGLAGLLGAVPLVAAGCYDPSDPTQVAPFVITLLVFIFGSTLLITVVTLALTGRMLRGVMRGVAGGLGAGPQGDTLVDGVPSEAVVQTIADTGWTMSMPGVGAQAPRYELGLLVTPVSQFSTPYVVSVTVVIPRIFVPMIVPGARIPVVVDQANPSHVLVDFTRMGAVPSPSA